MVVLKFGVFPHCYSVFCAVCMQAMTHSTAYVPSQQVVELVVVGAGFIDAMLVLIFLGDQWQRKVE